MKTPSRIGTKSPAKAQSKTPELSGAEVVALAKEAVSAYQSYNQLETARAETERVKAEALKEIELSDNELRQAQLKHQERCQEIALDRLKADNEHQLNEQAHQRWQQNHQSREQTIEILRRKVSLGEASDEEYQLLQLLHKLPNL